MLVRRGNVKDWPFIYRLACTAAQSSISPWRKQSMEESLKYRERQIKGLWTWIQQTGSIVFIAESDEDVSKPIGYVILQPRSVEELTGLSQAWIMDIAVIPEYRGQGTAKGLLAAAEGYCKSIKMPYLGLAVSTHNQSALRLYEKAGFIEERKLMIKLLS